MVPVREHGVPVTLDDLPQGDGACRPCRAGRREDPTAGGEQLLVRRAGRPQGELVSPVTREGGVRVAVDEPRDRREPPTVDLLDVVALAVAVDPKVAHRTNRLDEAVAHEHVRVLDHLDLAERATAERQLGDARSHDLGQVADEQPAHQSGLTTWLTT